MNKWLLHSRAGFTLIELLVVITIMMIVLFATYIPYAHHQKKVFLKQWAKELTQSLSEARNLSINGLDSGSWNVSVGLFFASGATEIDYYTISHTWSFSLISPPVEKLKTKKLPQGIQIDSIWWVGADTLISFSSIYGTWTMLQWALDQAIPDELDFRISFRWATTSVLQEEIRYYGQSYISDY